MPCCPVTPTAYDASGRNGLSEPNLSCFEPFDDNRLSRFVGAIQLIRP